MTDTITHLDDLIAGLQAEADALVERFELERTAALDRLRRARELRDTFADPPPTPAPPGRAARQVACPDCGQLFPNRHAVDSHRRDQHQRSAAKPAATSTPKATAAGGFVCDVCGDSCPSARGLAVHKGIKHKASKLAKPARPAPSTRPAATAKPGSVEPKLPENTTPLEWDLPERTSVDHEATSVYRCSECGEERATVDGLSQHTYSTHGRPVRVTEQTAVDPAKLLESVA